MIKAIALQTLLLLSVSAFAQERIELRKAEINVGADSAIVVRTNKTPDTVELTFRVPMENSVCERYDTRYVVVTSGLQCGYDYYERRVPAGSVCVRSDRHGRCHRFETTYRIERVQRPRTCTVAQSYCTQYGTATSYEEDKMKIRFKDLPALGDSESETFSITATQKRYDSGSVVFEVKPLETLREYEVNRKKILFIKTDTYEVTER